MIHKHLVLAGAGHAHLTTILHLAEIIRMGHRVTVISPEPYHYYSGMAPGMLCGIYSPQQVRFHMRRMVEMRGGDFVEDRVERVIPERRVLFLSSGRHVNYDVVSFNIGSEIPLHQFGESHSGVIPVKPVHNMLRVRNLILGSPVDHHLKIVVVGGGPAGVEIAANARSLLEKSGRCGEVTLIAGTMLLKEHPRKIRRLAADSLRGKGVCLMENIHVSLFSLDEIHLTDGKAIPYDLVLVAVGVRPPSLFSDSGIPTDATGGLIVNGHLQSVQFPNVFGGGDCISPVGTLLSKTGVHAVRQNPVLRHNLGAMLTGEALKKFAPQGSYLLVMNMGDGTGIAWKGGLAWNGRLAFRLKDFIDRRFMRRFQVSGELSEPL